jgi:hypothetical protein
MSNAGTPPLSNVFSLMSMASRAIESLEARVVSRVLKKKLGLKKFLKKKVLYMI